MPRSARLTTLPLAEREWQATVVDLASKTGWLHYHTYNSRRSAKGFLDLVLVRETVVFAELKTDEGQLRPEQKVWIEALCAAGQEVHVWRPRDFAEVQARLTRKK